MFEINSINKIIETFHITDLVLASTMPQAIMLIYLYMPKMAEIYILHGAKKRPQNTSGMSQTAEGLKQWVKDVSNDGEQRAQFRRCVRYLKRWKNKNFTSNGNTAPPSIGLTIQAKTSFVYKKEDDLSCLIGIAKSIRDSFTLSFSVDDMKFYKVVDVPLPVAPGKNVYYKMTKKQLDNYYNKVDELSRSVGGRSRRRESLGE